MSKDQPPIKALVKHLSNEIEVQNSTKTITILPKIATQPDKKIAKKNYINPKC